MKPDVLTYHSKPITCLKYNKEGDFLFVSSKDQSASIWKTEKGKLFGVLPHNSSVTSIDVSDDTSKCLTTTSSGDIILWDVKTGKQLVTYPNQDHQASCVQFSLHGNKEFLVALNKAFKVGNSDKPSIAVYSIRENTFGNDKVIQKPKYSLEFADSKMNITAAAWGPLNQFIILGHSNGCVTLIDTEKGKIVGKEQLHTDVVTSISMNPKNRMYFATSSHDKTCKLVETLTLKQIKEYKSPVPVNCVSISPKKYHLIHSGGTKAVDVTTTFHKGHTFDIEFAHLIFQESVGTVKGHFGPVNYCSYCPDGSGFCSGGEDGMIRLHHFDSEYLSIKDTPNFSKPSEKNFFGE